MLGVMDDHHSDLVLIEWETLQVSDVAFSIPLGAILARDFTEERILNFYAEAFAGLLHHLVARVSLVVVLLRVDERPSLVLQGGGLGVFNSPTCVIFPTSGAIRCL